MPWAADLATASGRGRMFTWLNYLDLSVIQPVPLGRVFRSLQGGPSAIEHRT